MTQISISAPKSARWRHTSGCQMSSHIGTPIITAGALTNNAQRLVDVSAAQWCADNQLANLKLARQFPGIGDSDFSCEQLGHNYQGQLRVRPTPNPNFRRIDVSIAGEDAGPLLTLSTVLARY